MKCFAALKILPILNLNTVVIAFHAVETRLDVSYIYYYKVYPMVTP